jgi:hypothetical protein
MMYPEMMEIVIKSHHRYLRSLAHGDSFLDDVQHLLRLFRNALGRGMVRTGRWIEGQAPVPADAVPATT